MSENEKYERLNDFGEVLYRAIDEVFTRYRIVHGPFHIPLLHDLMKAILAEIDLDSFLGGATVAPDPARSLSLKAVTDFLKKNEDWWLDSSDLTELSDDLVAAIASRLVDGVPDRTNRDIVGRLNSYLSRIDELVEMARRDLRLHVKEGEA